MAPLVALLPALGTLGTIAGVAGAGLGALGAISSSQSQANVMEFNADLANIRARETEIATAEEGRLGRMRLARILGTQRAQYAGSGVSSSSESALTVESETELEGKREIDLTERAGLIESAMMRAQGDMFKKQASATRTAGFLSAGGTLLGTGAKHLGGGGFDPSTSAFHGGFH